MSPGGRCGGGYRRSQVIEAVGVVIVCLEGKLSSCLCSCVGGTKAQDAGAGKGRARVTFKSAMCLSSGLGRHKLENCRVEKSPPVESMAW